MVEAGQRLGDYVVEAELGGGGMAVVYRARHSVLDTVHALKVLNPSYRAIPEARSRFLEEAKIQAKHLDHPGIVKVTDIVATADVAALVMELVDGPSLEAHIEGAKRPPSDAELLAIALPVLDAIGHAHQEGIIHRDLKPANILLERTDAGFEPRITDFGIAKVQDKSSKKSTHADARMGTLAYMSPEQIRRAKDVTARSDIFSLGAVLYELATLELPFDGDSDYDVMEQIVHGRLTPVAERAPSLDPGIAAAITRALSPKPEDRFASCEEMATALRGTEGAVQPAPARRPSRAARPRPRSRSRSRVWIAALAVAAVLGGGVTAIAVMSGGGSKSARAPAPAETVDAQPLVLPSVTLPGRVDGSQGMFPAPIGGSPSAGPADAPLTLVAFVDFDDPVAVAHLREIGWVSAGYGPQVRVAVKPIGTSEDASRIARTLLAANLQVNGVKVVLSLFESGRFDDEYLFRASAGAGADVANLVAARESDAVRAQWLENVAMARALGADGPFALSVNGHPLREWPSALEFVFFVVEQMGRARASQANSNADDYYASLIADMKPGAPTWIELRATTRSRAPLQIEDRLGLGTLSPPLTAAAVKGPPRAKHRIDVFADLADPAYAQQQKILAEVRREHPNDLLLTFRNHYYKSHTAVALAAAAARRQGKLWEFHDALFAGRKPDPTSVIQRVSAAQSAGLDTDLWRRQTGEPFTQSALMDETQIVSALGLPSTPFFAVNGQPMDDLRSADNVERVFKATRP